MRSSWRPRPLSSTRHASSLLLPPPPHGPRAAQGERRRRARGRARGRAQVVAGRAAFFLGNVWSTFSWAIVEERWARLGAQEDSNALQQAPFSPQELAARGPVRVLR